MPLPLLNEHGLLPVGMHSTSIDTVKERFGRFQSSDRRVVLFETLTDYLADLKRLDTAVAIIVDGSFVTAKSRPNDVDIIVVLSDAHDFERVPSPVDYNVLSKRRVRSRFKLDILVAVEESELLTVYINFFSQVRDNPDVTKGLVRVQL